MATLRQREVGWQALIRRKGHEPVCKTFRTKQEAERWARSIEADMDKGIYVDTTLAEKTCFKELIERYMREVTPTMRSTKEDLIRLNAICRHPICLLNMTLLTSTRLAEYRDERLKQVSSGTVIREFAYFSSIINHARREWGINVANPVLLVKKPPSPQGRTRILNEAEKIRLLNALEPINRRSILMKPLVEFALETAMRRGEMLGLKWKNVDMHRQIAFLELTKNGESRTVPLSTAAIAVLQQLQRVDERVFPINHAAVSANFARARKRANLEDVHFHDLRHTAITMLSLKLPNVLELAAVSGHKELRMLKRYHHPNPVELAKKLG